MRTMIKSKTQSAWIDLLKLLFAYCVVAIHTQVADEAPLYLQFWTAMAVSFFFICSGFFFQEKLNKSSPETYRGGKELLQEIIRTVHNLGIMVFNAGRA